MWLRKLRPSPSPALPKFDDLNRSNLGRVTEGRVGQSRAGSFIFSSFKEIQSRREQQEQSNDQQEQSLQACKTHCVKSISRKHRADQKIKDRIAIVNRAYALRLQDIATHELIDISNLFFMSSFACQRSHPRARRLRHTIHADNVCIHQRLADRDDNNSSSYSPITCKTNSLCRGRLSKSIKIICCHVPNVKRPLTNGTVSEAPSSAARTWL